MTSTPLSDAKRALLERMLAGGPKGPAIPRSGASAYPLSFAQQRMWVMEQMRPGTAAYNSHVALRLSGPVDEERLEHALREIVGRHGVLRGAFVCDGPALSQRIDPAATLRLERSDCSASEVDARLRGFLEAPIPLERPPLVRALLLRTAPEVRTLMVVVHHAVFDGWSAERLVDELLRLAAGEVLPPLPVQYGDYAVWQREQLRGERLEKERSWWRERLGGASPVTTFPPDRARTAARDERAAIVRTTVDAATTAALRAFACQSGATLFTALLAAFDTLLFRYSGVSDIAITSPVAGRTVSECEPLIGLFMNALPIRVRFDGRPSFREVVSRVRASALEAFAHQELPFEQIIDATSPERTIAQTPFSHVMFQLRSFPRSAARLPGVAVERLRLEAPAARCDLEVEVRDDGEVLDCLLEYSTELYDGTTVERIARHFGALLRSALATPDAPVAALPILDESELHEIVYDWNATACDYRGGSTVTEIFEEIVARRPGAVAVIDGDRRATYAEVDRAAAALAAEIRAAGIPPRSPVAISGERSLEAVIAALGIMKAGCCYVPVDPSWPADRVGRIFDGCGTRGVIRGTRLEVLGAGAEAAGAEDRPIGPDDPIYIMYTSGSTGEPKGIVIPHRGVTRLVINTNFARFGPDEAVAMCSSFAFDGVTFELWGALLHGAKLVVVSREEVLDPARLRAVIERHGITLMFLTTSVIRQHAKLDPEMFRGVREVMTGGEAFDAQTAERLLRAGVPRLVNVYGPTEATAWAVSHEVTADDVRSGVIPIGRPIANSTAYVLDPERRPQPVGVTGELYLGGPGVALGYVGRPELTAERFVDSPFVAGDRLYRTGDLARCRADGTIEFLGRNDDQIKLRGYRIEPAEIETVLLSHPDVVHAAVTVLPVASEHRLVAYVCCRRDGIAAPELRQFLSSRLPDYMVPAHFAVLGSMPLNSSGKVDRRALPALEIETGTSRIEPRDALDAQVAALLEESLGATSLGIDDDFFESGGNSIGAIMLLAAVERQLGRRVPVEVFFQRPTVRGVSDFLREHDAHVRRVFVTLQPDGSGLPLVLVPGGDGTEERLLGYGKLARELAERPVYGVFYRPDEHGGCTSVEELAARFREEIEAHVPAGPVLLAGHCIGGTVAYEIAQQLHARGREVAGVVMFESRRPAGKRTKFEQVSAVGRVRMLFSRVGRHLRLAAGLPMRQRAGYLLSQLTHAATWTSYLLAGRGAEARDPAPEDPYTDLVRHYEPRGWDGPLAMVISDTAKRPWEMRAWSGLSSRVKVVRIPGDHMTILREHAAIAAQAIRDAIA